MLDSAIRRINQLSGVLVAVSIALFAVDYLQSPTERLDDAQAKLQTLRTKLEERTKLFRKQNAGASILTTPRLALATHWARAGDPARSEFPPDFLSLLEFLEADKDGAFWNGAEQQSEWLAYLSSDLLSRKEGFPSCPKLLPPVKDLAVSEALDRFAAGTRDIRVVEFRGLALQLQQALKDCLISGEGPLIRNAYFADGMKCEDGEVSLDLVLNESERKCPPVATLRLKTHTVAWFPPGDEARRKGWEDEASLWRASIVSANSDLLNKTVQAALDKLKSSIAAADTRVEVGGIKLERSEAADIGGVVLAILLFMLGVGQGIVARNAKGERSEVSAVLEDHWSAVPVKFGLHTILPMACALSLMLPLTFSWRSLFTGALLLLCSAFEVSMWLAARVALKRSA